MKQHVEITRGEPARQTEPARAVAFDPIAAERSLAYDLMRPGSWQRRVGGCSRSVHE
ncbi:MAG: hypothetical protein U0236_18555 [Nitrospira sp.]